ncbi:V-type immunoglobulin domain-containing suppressor of T-cell activation isoform X2 [Hyperolius riggenbachi]|uniref:V-type immunoglobulin domain-containing suppressor of T-cell activation isoform X2 n=1 Tax=Hyperolius riggenbachi TaxID=752182 RepID=UPI0035A31593
MDLLRRSPRPTCSVWKCWIVLCFLLALYQGRTVALSDMDQHVKYVCPEGQNVNLTCPSREHINHHHEHLAVLWIFSKTRNPDCSGENRHHKDHKPVHSPKSKILLNITNVESGSYCCFLYKASKKHLVPETYNYRELHVKTDDPNLKTCLTLTIGNDSDGAQELVRMDSEAQGIDNPVFDDPPVGNPEQRPRLVFMSSRQQSDSGRHLLSEPNTPLSPPGPNDCFFPSLEPVPDSPDPV